MSKPLELTIYPPLGEEPNPVRDGWDAWHEWDALFTKECRIRRPKRLTEPELCAEFESARCDFLVMQHTGGVWTPLRETWPMNPQDTGNRVGALMRFATHPHYFEATEPESDTE